MAIRAADFHKLGIAERHWANTVSDDYTLTRAVRESGGRIAFEPRCLMASREESSLREFLRWSTRQIVITRVYATHLWRWGLATYLFYCGTLALGLVVLSMPGLAPLERGLVAITLCAVILLGAGKGYIRSLVARELFPARWAAVRPAIGSCRRWFLGSCCGTLSWPGLRVGSTGGGPNMS